MSLILRRARIPGVTGTADVTVRHGIIERIEVERIEPAGAAAPDAHRVIDLAGRYLRPGLWDEHTHFTQWVTQRRRVGLEAAASAAHAVNLVRAALAASAAPLVVGHGFRDALWPDAPTRAALDELAPDRPVVLVSGDLHCGWLNSAAGRQLGVRVPPDGLLRETEWIAAFGRLDAADRPGHDDVRAAAVAAAARGVVGIVDFENADNTRIWPERVSAGVTALRVEASVWPDRLDDAIDRGLRTGDRLEPGGLVRMGRLKVVVDGSLNTRTALCWDPYPAASAEESRRYGVQSVPPDRLTELLARAHAAGIAPAVHAIGDRANTQVLDAFAALAIPGRIEHAQLVAAADFARFGALGITASVQPEHAMDDRDVAEVHWPGRTERAFAFASLLAHGAKLALGSDAPVAPLDPWIAIAAAVSRSRDGRAPWQPSQRLAVGAALAASARGRSSIRPGDIADLIVTDDDPAAADAGTLRTMTVSATFVGGRPTWNTLKES